MIVTIILSILPSTKDKTLPKPCFFFFLNHVFWRALCFAFFLGAEQLSLLKCKKSIRYKPCYTYQPPTFHPRKAKRIHYHQTRLLKTKQLYHIPFFKHFFSKQKPHDKTGLSAGCAHLPLPSLAQLLFGGFVDESHHPEEPWLVAEMLGVEVLGHGCLGGAICVFVCLFFWWE